MPLTEVEGPDGRLTIERRLLPVKRALGGTVFGSIAVLILYTIIDVLIFNLRNAPGGELRRTMAGYGVMFVGFLLFAVPSWMFFFWRGRVVIALQEGTVRGESDYRLFRRGRTFRVDQVMAVHLWRHGSDRAPAFPVDLVMKGGKRVRVSEERAKESSKKLARRLAVLLRVSFENQV
jgi:hypothetical protein